MSKVLIPPQAFTTNTEGELIAQVNKAREAAVTKARAVGEIRELVNKAHEMVSLKLRPKRST